MPYTPRAQLTWQQRKAANNRLRDKSNARKARERQLAQQNNNDIPQANEHAASPNVGATVLSTRNPFGSGITTPVETNATEPPQTENDGNSNSHSTRQSAPSPLNLIRTTGNRPPVLMLPPIPPNDALILKISHLLLIDYVTAAKFHRAIISSSDAALTPGSSGYFDKLAPLYAQSEREVQRCGFLKELMNQYGLWVGLGEEKDKDMKVIDYGCGVGALSQALAPHVTRILGIDTSKGMVNLYNATLARWVMGAVQGRLVAGERVNWEAEEEFGTMAIPEGLGEGWALLGFCLSIDFLCSPTLPHYTHDILVRTLEILLPVLCTDGILLVIDIEKVHDTLGPAPGTAAYGQEFLRGGKKVRGYGSWEIAAACVELELDDIEIMEGVEFTWEGDDGNGGRRVKEEEWFMLRAKKGGRFLSRMMRRFPGVHVGDIKGSP